MKTTITVSSLLLSVLLIALYCRADSPRVEKTVEQDLLDAVSKVATQHGMSPAEVTQRARTLLLGSQAWPVKGGVAVIRDEMYVITNNKTNQVIVGGETFGSADFKSPEVFVFADKRFIGSLRLPQGSEKDVILALFAPDKVSFFDWKGLSGGFYPRYR